ncbi:DUF4175 domain-containing protein [Pigmentiphaga aceris]|uniref:DUF4175 domain-containing protein n=1 Tax=Pigmentiphaga aceris TaxID=1940612 RepID=A0A5C0AYF1_9BURK|nr:DUF4175 domain-containing protein [Pigmentiphaga aceris]QEI07438.1 DUF4175 domain-containing protein [Pigmentiphaga aceris]
MDTLIDLLPDLLLFLLIGIAVAPLLLLGLYVVTDYFKLAIADRILDLIGHLLKLQWLTGSVVNIVGGIALAALGVWSMFHFDPQWQRWLGVLLVPFGLWRAWRGLALLRA